MTAQRRLPGGRSKFSISTRWQHRYAFTKVEYELACVVECSVSVHGLQTGSDVSVVFLAFSRLESVDESVGNNCVRELVNIGIFHDENQPRRCRFGEANDEFVKTQLRFHRYQMPDRKCSSEECCGTQYRDS